MRTSVLIIYDKMNDDDNEPRSVHEYQLTTNNDYETNISGWHLDPNHTHFLLFDDGSNDVKNMLLKRQEVEHELSISRQLKSPVNGYKSASDSTYLSIFNHILRVIHYSTR